MVICSHCRHRANFDGPTPFNVTLTCEGCGAQYRLMPPEPLRIIQRAPRFYRSQRLRSSSVKAGALPNSRKAAAG